MGVTDLVIHWRYPVEELLTVLVHRFWSLTTCLRCDPCTIYTRNAQTLRRFSYALSSTHTLSDLVVQWCYPVAGEPGTEALLCCDQLQMQHLHAVQMSNAMHVTLLRC